MEANNPPKILVLTGSARLDSIHRKLARQTVEALRDAGVEATLADLRDFPMPIYDGDLEPDRACPPPPRRSRNWHAVMTASPLRHRNITAPSPPC